VTADNYNIFGHSGNAGLVGVLPGDSDMTPVEPLIKIIRTQLSDHGGPTLTHALPLGSPAIDRFSSLYCTLLPIEGLDQRGEPRNKDGDGTPSNQECDIGSFERQPPEFQLFLPVSAASTVFD
jgi:hypothetical protein